MKKFGIASLVAGVLLSASAHAAITIDGQVTLTAPVGRIGQAGGGPFIATVSNPTSPTMQAIVNAGNGFLTFCLERSESITLPGGPYYADVNTAAAKGGGGAVADIVHGTSDPLSMATAWLYSQFRVGGLADDFSAQSRTFWQGANDVQMAIWWLENEYSTDGLFGANSGNYLVTAAINALDLILDGTDNNNITTANIRGLNHDNRFGVYALNLYSGNLNSLTYRQDVLAMVPEPSTYVAGALLMIPVLVQYRRWRRNK